MEQSHFPSDWFSSPCCLIYILCLLINFGYFHSFQAVHHHLIFALIAAVVSPGWQHGYNSVVINTCADVVKLWICETRGTHNCTVNDDGQLIQEPQEVTTIWSLVGSLPCFGGIIGGIITSWLAEHLGRKRTILINNIPVIIYCGLVGFAKRMKSVEMLLVGRFIIGINNGLGSGIVPLYLTEISPAHIRGIVGSLYQMVLVVAIVISQMMGTKYVMGTAELWPLLFSISIFFAVFQLLTFVWCPESPKNLLNKNKEEEAIAAVKWFNGSNEAAFATMLGQVKTEDAESKMVQKSTCVDMFRTRQLRTPMIIAMVIMGGQQLSGINCVMFYSTDIFSKASLSLSESQLATLGMGVVNVLMTIVSTAIVDIAGRKTLLLIGFIGMVFTTVGLFISLLLAQTAPAGSFIPYLSIVMVLLFVVCFATGPGSIPWFLVSEMFLQNSRGMAISIAVTVNWTCNSAVALLFPHLNRLLHSYVFLIFVGLQAFFAFFITVFLPETKNKPIEEITALFK